MAWPSRPQARGTRTRPARNVRPQAWHSYSGPSATAVYARHSGHLARSRDKPQTLPAQCLVVDVRAAKDAHACVLVEPVRAGQALGVHTEPDSVETAAA